MFDEKMIYLDNASATRLDEQCDPIFLILMQ